MPLLWYLTLLTVVDTVKTSVSRVSVVYSEVVVDTIRLERLQRHG